MATKQTLTQRETRQKARKPCNILKSVLFDRVDPGQFINAARDIQWTDRLYTPHNDAFRIRTGPPLLHILIDHILRLITEGEEVLALVIRIRHVLYLPDLDGVGEKKRQDGM